MELGIFIRVFPIIFYILQCPSTQVSTFFAHILISQILTTFSNKVSNSVKVKFFTLWKWIFTMMDNWYCATNSSVIDKAESKNVNCFCFHECLTKLKVKSLKKRGTFWSNCNVTRQTVKFECSSEMNKKLCSGITSHPVSRFS